MIYTKVAKILDPTAVVLAAGSEAGVREGMEFVIYELSDEITDPENGESLGRIELHKGRVEVRQVEPKVSVASTPVARPGLSLAATRVRASRELARLGVGRHDELPLDRPTASPGSTLTVRVGDAARSEWIVPALLEKRTEMTPAAPAVSFNHAHDLPRVAADRVPEIVRRVTAVVGPANVLTARPELAVYECDGFTVEKNRPDVVVFPTTTEHVVGIVRACNDLDVPFMARGAGTSLAGGCVPVGGGVMIALARMKKILDVNVRDRYALVEAGVVNVWLTNQLKPHGYHYAPDPSSQGACTIGGNVATNSGGPHTLKYGVTVNHVLGVEMVLPDGSVVVTGGPCEDSPGYDLTGLIVGSEGTFGIVTKAWVRLTRNPEAYRTLLGVFETVGDATSAISEIIGAGIVPAALELLDQTILGAIEAAFKFGFPLDAGAVLIMEVDGLSAGLQDEADRIEEIALRHRAREVRKAATDADRLLLWKARKQAFGTIGRLGYPSYCTQDGVVPRTKLPEVMAFIQATAAKYGVAIANVFHAGDGNIHPILMFDERDPVQVQKVLGASTAILEECIRLGGSVTGEHGIGVEKLDFMPKLFAPEDLAYMARVRSAFNPAGRCSPNKLLPTAGGCAEPTRVEQLKPGRRAAL